MTGNPLLSLGKAYLRWRHSKGFGVHSPFAFRIVESVVSPGKYAYYGYADIDYELNLPGAAYGRNTRHDARLLLRLMATLRIRTLLMAKSSSCAIFKAAGKGAGAECRMLRHGDVPPAAGSAILLAEGSLVAAADAATFLCRGGIVFATDPTPEMRLAITGGFSNGLVLEGTRIVIAIPRKDMTFTRYTMAL